MTEADMYQIIGKAYCDGYQEGLSKQASLEKQALSPKLLLGALKGIAGKGNLNNTMRMAGRIAARAQPVTDALSKIKPAFLNSWNSGVSLTPAIRSTLEQLKWDKLSKRIVDIGKVSRAAGYTGDLYKNFGKGLNAASNAGKAYASSALSKLLR